MSYPYYTYANIYQQQPAIENVENKSTGIGISDGPLSNKFILILTILAAIGGLIFFIFWITGSVESPASTDTADSFGDSTESSDTTNT